MSKATKTLAKVLRGNADANIRFGDLCTLLQQLGFRERITGDHHILQVRGVITSNGLAGGEEAELGTEESDSD